MANQISTQPTKHLKVSEPDTSNIREQSTTSMALPLSSRYNKPFSYYEMIYFVKIQSQCLFDYIMSKLGIIPPFRTATCGLCSHRGMDMTFGVTEHHTRGEVSIMSRKSRVSIPKICFKMTSNTNTLLHFVLIFVQCYIRHNCCYLLCFRHL